MLPSLPPNALALALAGSLSWGTTACRAAPPSDSKPDAASASASAVLPAAPAPAVPGGMGDARPANHFANVPLQCYARVERSGGVSNPCYVCHQRSRSPNFSDDAELQLKYLIAPAGAKNPWKNALARPVAASLSDDELALYVRRSNYFDLQGGIALRQQLERLPAAWDGEGDGKWDGFVPDALYRFDDEGFDREGTRDTGWRAFAYRPFPGAFLPSNGSLGDVLIRLDSKLQSDLAGRYSRAIYRLNLAVVEALVTRRDVPIAPTDERELGVDLDLNGVLASATQVKFDRAADAATGRTRMRYVGAGRDAIDPILFPIAVGLFPLGTEFLHSVRYLDVAEERVRMAARMKELRYARKARWLSYDDLKRDAISEPAERSESPDGSRRIIWQFDRGAFNGQGWLYQGFIEAADGQLRPQSFAETTPCVGCHGGIGATDDGIFSFSRKLAAGAFRDGWFHWSQHGLDGVGDQRLSDGELEYASYLRRAGSADDFGENSEARARFFDAQGRARPEALARLQTDVSELLVPSVARALALDRAYLAIVREQSFEQGRDTLLSSAGILTAVTPDGATGIRVGYRP